MTQQSSPEEPYPAGDLYTKPFTAESGSKRTCLWAQLGLWAQAHFFTQTGMLSTCKQLKSTLFWGLDFGIASVLCPIDLAWYNMHLHTQTKWNRLWDRHTLPSPAPPPRHITLIQISWAVSMWVYWIEWCFGCLQSLYAAQKVGLRQPVFWQSDSTAGTSWSVQDKN